MKRSQDNFMNNTIGERTSTTASGFHDNAAVWYILAVLFPGLLSAMLLIDVYQIRVCDVAMRNRPQFAEASIIKVKKNRRGQLVYDLASTVFENIYKDGHSKKASSIPVTPHPNNTLTILYAADQPRCWDIDASHYQPDHTEQTRIPIGRSINAAQRQFSMIMEGVFGVFFLALFLVIIVYAKWRHNRPRPVEHTHSLHTNENGSTSLKHVASGETMHSLIGPEREAQILYINQSSLVNSLLANRDTVVLDVGLGIAANALMAIDAALNATIEHETNLQIISFETDLSSLELALTHIDRFPLLVKYGEIVRELLSQNRIVKQYNKLTIEWQLLEGDAVAYWKRNILRRSDIVYVFYDFYSHKVDKSLWSIETFTALKHYLGPNEFKLFTYSGSTHARLNLLLSQFFVGKGTSTGAKAQTTIAASAFNLLQAPLAEDFIHRINTSSLYTESDRQHVLAQLKTHPQFRNLA